MENNITRHHSITEYAKKLMPGSVSSPSCHEHDGKECILWCQTCGKAVCVDCVTTSHHGHRFTKIETVLREKRESLQKELKNLESKDLKEWQDLLKEAQKVTSDFLDQVNGIEKEIDRRAKEFPKREAFEKYKKQLNKMKTLNLDILHKQERSVKDGLEKVKQEIKEYENRLRSSNTEILLEHKDAKRDTKETLPTISGVILPILAESYIDIKSLTEMLDKLTVDKATQGFSPPSILISKPSVQSKFVTETSCPSMTCSTSGQAWVVRDLKKLQLVDKHGSAKDTIHTDFDFNHMALSTRGDILLTDTSNNSIKSISPNKTVKTLCELPCRPWGLCCLQSGDIIVTFYGEGRVVIYSISGEFIKELEKKLFGRPYRVAQSTINSDLYISDTEAAKVLVLDKDYKVRYSYNGPENRASFSPRDLCTDKVRHVLITDYYNNSVHILDRDGRFLQYLLTRAQGLSRPMTIDVDNEGKAWVGELSGVKVLRYLH